MRIAPICRFKPAIFALAAWVAISGIGLSRAIAFDQCPQPQFGVSGISVDTTAATAAEAQVNGISEAAAIGFQRVLQRLLRSQAAMDAFMAEASVDQFVDFYHISEENSLQGRYIAVLDYCFDAPRLRAAFRQAGLEWAELKSPRILVLPVWLAPDGARAWQTDNEWLAGWRDVVRTADGLVDFTLLQPTILNERSLRAEDIVAANPVILRRAATVAGADQVMLVTARLDYNGSQPVLAVDGELFTADAERLTVLARMVDRPVHNNLTAQLDFARTRILSELETGWHRANLIRGGETREITVSVPVASLQDWVSRLEAFKSVTVIDEVIIRKLDMTGGLVSLKIVGNDAAIANALAAYNLRLVQRNDGGNVIEPF